MFELDHKEKNKMYHLQLTSKYQEPITTLANNFLSSSEMFSIANISGSI